MRGRLAAGASDLRRAYKAHAKHRSKHSRQSTSASSSGTSTPTSNPATPAKLDDAGDSLIPLSDREKCFLSREQLQRFLRAVKWDLNAVRRQVLYLLNSKAITRTEVVLVWRREYGTDDLSYEDIKEESLTGKVRVDTLMRGSADDDRSSSSATTRKAAR